MLQGLYMRMTLVVMVVLLSCGSASAEEARRVVYVGGTEEEAKAALLRLNIVDASSFIPMEQLTFPGENGLWAVGSEDAWDCTEPATPTVIASLLEQATNAFFAAEYAAAQQTVERTLQHLACGVHRELIAEALYLRGMIACVAEKVRTDGTPVGDGVRATDFFMFAHGTEPELTWNIEFPTTCRVMSGRGEEEFDARANFEFAAQTAREARADASRWLPVTVLAPDHLAVSGLRDDGHTAPPAVHQVTWTHGTETRQRLVAIDAHMALSLVSEAGWSHLLHRGPQNAAEEKVLESVFTDSTANAVTLVVLSDGKAKFAYTVYPRAHLDPVVVHEIPHDEPQKRLDPSRLPRGAIGVSATAAWVGPGFYFGPSVAARVRLIGGLHLHVEGALAFLSFDGNAFMLPAFTVGARYHFGFKTVQPNVGVEAMMTFTNHPDREPILVGALGCGGFRIRGSEEVSPLFVSACAGYGTFGPAALGQTGLLFH